MSRNSSPPRSSRFRLRPRRLATSLLLAFLILALLPVIGSAVFSAIVQADLARESAVDRLEGVAAVKTQQLQGWIDARQTALWINLTDENSYESILAILGHAEEDGEDDAHGEFTTHAGLFVGASGPFEQILLADGSGTVLAEVGTGPSVTDVSGQSFFEDGRLLATVSPPLRDTATDSWSVYFSVPVNDQSGDLAGVLIGRASGADLEALTAERAGLGETGEVLLVVQPSRMVTKNRAGEMLANAQSQGISNALAGLNGQAVYRDYQNRQVVGVYRWLPQLSTGMVVKQDASEALAASRVSLRTNVFIAVVAGLAALALGIIFVRGITRPITQLTDTAVRIAEGDRSLRVELERDDELGSLAGAFNDMTERVRGLVDTLEERVAQRTRDLETTAEISRAISAVRDLDILLNQVTELICQRYGYYHAQVFLIDDVGEYAVLRSSTGERGQRLLERGHKLAVGSQSVIGQVTSQGRPVVAYDTDSSTVHRRNELLPDTRSELALPLRLGDQIIGALDVQSVAAEAFEESTIEVLQAVADQLSIAVNNSRLFAESQSLLDEQIQLSQILTREGWDEHIKRGTDVTGYAYDLNELRPINGEAIDEEKQGFKATIRLRGETIGELTSVPGEGREWDDDDSLLVEAVAERVALALENARLLGRTQETLQEVGRLYQAGRAIVEATNVEEVLYAVTFSSVRFWVERVAVVLVNDPEAGFDESGATVCVEWYRDTEGINTPDVPLTSEMLPVLAKTGEKARVIRDVETSDLLDKSSQATLLSFGDKSGIYLPMLASSGVVIGWLMIASTTRHYEPAEEEIRYFRAIADQAGIAIDGHRLFEQAQQRALKLQATNAVSHAAASILDIDLLLPQVVEQIRDNFGFYHVQVFLVDEPEGMAVLQASTGDVGRELLAQGHKLPVGSQSVIGQVTIAGVPVIAHDTDTDPVHRSNELLPNTRSEMAIPIRHGQRVVGALDVQSRHANAFVEEDITVLQTLADQLAVALENAQLFQDTQERVAELTTINLISQEVSHAHTLDALFDSVRSQMGRAFEAQDGFLALYDREADRLDYPIYLQDGEAIDAESGALEPGLLASIIKSRSPLVLNSGVAEAVEEAGGDPKSVRAKSWLGVPLTTGQQVLGVLSIQNPEQENAFKDSHLRMISTLAAYVAVAVRNAQLYSEAEQRASDLGLLFDVTSAALGLSELDDALLRIAESLRDEMENAEATLVTLVDETGQHVIPRAASGYGHEIMEFLGGPRPVEEGLVGWAVSNGQAVLVGDVRDDPRYVAASPTTLSEVAVPLMVGDEAVGALVVESSQLDAFGDDDLRLLQTLSGTLSAIIQNARLIDEIRQANEQLRELDKMKSQFLANMSHELRTPLNSIIGFSRVILKGIDGPLTDLQEQDLQTIYSSGQHLLGLINDVLDMSKIEAGKLDLSHELVDLHAVFEGVMSTAVGLVKGKSIELITEVPAELPEVYGDEMRIRQVLLNLLSNAAKFTNDGSITLRAEVADQTAEEAAHICISIADTGIGIAEEDMEKLFEAFSQVDASTTRATGGTGLGLSISRSLVNLIGGRVWVESKEGVGSTFSFTIPTTPQPTQTEPIPALAFDDNGDKPVVLTVDDDEGVLKLYKRFLEKEGYNVVGLSSGHGVVDIIRHAQPVAIVLDVMMPDRDGWDVIADLKLNPDTKHVPIILCTIVEERDRAAKLGVNDYLAKPIVEDDLLAALRRLDVDGDDHHDEGAPAGGQANSQAADQEETPADVLTGEQPDARDEEPVDARADRQDDGQVSAGGNGHAVGRELSILVIDDQPELLKLASDGLQADGVLTVSVAQGGRAGLEAIQKEKPDVIVLSLDMPDVDGFQVLASLAGDPATSDIPVLLLTAKDLSPEEYGRLTEQAVSMVSKADRSPEDLLRSITVALAGMQ